MFTVYFRWLETISSRLDLKMAIKLTMTAILSLYLSFALDHYVQHPDYLIADLWCVVTSIIVLQTNIGGTYKAIWLRFVGVVIGSVIGAFFAFELGGGTESLGLAIFATIVICAVLGIPDSYRLAALSVAIIILPWRAHPENSPWSYAFFRFLDTCLGFLVAILVSHVLWPSRALNKMRINVAERFELFRQFFELLLNPQSSDERQQISKTLQEMIEQSFSQSQTVLEESKLELMMQAESLNIWIEMIECQKQLWESLWILQHVFSTKLEGVFDKGLKQHVYHTFEMINSALNELSLKLKNESTHLSFSSLQDFQDALNQELIRFRATQKIKNYDLSVVEDYFVFFYQLRQILVKLKNFNYLLDCLKLGRKD